MKPVLLLDVDGPLNPWNNKPHRRPAGYDTFRFPVAGTTARRPMRVWLRPAHGPQLLTLADRCGFKLVWATSWQAEANEFISPALGLPELPIVPFPEFDPVRGWPRVGHWKWDAVADYAGDRPLVWLDDEHQGRAQQANRERFLLRRGRVPTLLHHVSPRAGIDQPDLDAVEQFARAHWGAA